MYNNTKFITHIQPISELLLRKLRIKTNYNETIDDNSTMDNQAIRRSHHLQSGRPLAPQELSHF